MEASSRSTQAHVPLPLPFTMQENIIKAPPQPLPSPLRLRLPSPPPPSPPPLSPSLSPGEGGGSPIQKEGTKAKTTRREAITIPTARPVQQCPIFFAASLLRSVSRAVCRRRQSKPKTRRVVSFLPHGTCITKPGNGRFRLVNFHSPL